MPHPIAQPNSLSQLLLDHAALRVQLALLKLEMAFDRAVKAETHTPPTTHYVWRTRGDGKVRASHAANNGRIFAWDNPPPVGHPGEDFNCRCTAEPYVRGESEFAYQTLIGGIQNSFDKWSKLDFVDHFYFGGGRDVTLSETGHLAGVIDYYFYRIFREGKHSYDRVNAQIIDAARKHPSGAFHYDFNNSYKEFKKYLFVFGGVTIRGAFTGMVRHEKGMMYIQGNVEYHYTDTFTDPFDQREEQIGTSDPAAASPELLEDTEYGGTFYDISGEWRSSFQAEAKQDERASRYQWE
jgi:Phage Mu protein F like protein